MIWVPISHILRSWVFWQQAFYIRFECWSSIANQFIQPGKSVVGKPDIISLWWWIWNPRSHSYTIMRDIRYMSWLWGSISFLSIRRPSFSIRSWIRGCSVISVNKIGARWRFGWWRYRSIGIAWLLGWRFSFKRWASWGAGGVYSDWVCYSWTDTGKYKSKNGLMHVATTRLKQVGTVIKGV